MQILNFEYTTLALLIAPMRSLLFNISTLDAAELNLIFSFTTWIGNRLYRTINITSE